MTTPSERVRAIRLGAELLACIQADAGVEPRDRERAADLIDRYPDAQKWPVDTEVHAPPPTSGEAEVIFEAGVLFESLARTDRMGGDTANLWLAVMRHFPGTQDGCHNPEQIRRLFYPHPFHASRRLLEPRTGRQH